MRLSNNEWVFKKIYNRGHKHQAMTTNTNISTTKYGSRVRRKGGRHKTEWQRSFHKAINRT